MNADVQAKLEKLKANYSQVQGQPFSYFFCPILFRDDDVSLCYAHIINKAFPETARAWTVQREDVDSFYGKTVESEFVSVQYNKDDILDNAITDKKLSEIFKPQILVDDKPVDFFVATGETPKGFTRLDFDNNGEVMHFVLKMSPEDVFALSERNWEVSVSKDIRVPALVSLIKAAHLTLFEMFGYRYAFSLGGYFVGWHILGKFFLQNQNKQKLDVLKNAYPFFQQFVHMVRPIPPSEINFHGTITDKQFLFCKESTGPVWAVIIFVKIAQSLHAVMLPLFDEPGSAAKFFGFLKNENDTIDVLANFEEEGLKQPEKPTKLFWPKDGTLYPE